MEKSDQKKLDQNKKRESLQKEKNQIFRQLPRVDELMKKENVRKLAEKEGYERVLWAVRDSVENLRNEIAQGILNGISEFEAKEKIQKFLYEIESGAKKSEVNQRLEQEQKKEIHPVYNGTGVILHTGLGRAPLGHEIAEKLKAVAEHYSSLEYDLQTGKRGNRTGYAEELFCKITGAEAALVVNNNAGAVLLALSVLTKGGEVIVSRGELVEIGGKFRIPEVLELSGAVLKEVGTTNRTRAEDYKNAVSEKTKAFLKVHTSNYRIIGFTESVNVEELRELSDSLNKSAQKLSSENFVNRSERNKIPVIEDLGSGVLVNLEDYGFSKEPTVQEELKAGADVVCFSGDKLLGGAQAGVIVGKKEYIDQMRNHPLLRALRADKFTLTAIEEVLKCYLDQREAVRKIPTLRMLTSSVEEIKEKAIRCCERWMQEDVAVQIGVEVCSSKAGGGALPETEIPSYGVTLKPDEITVEELEYRMRNLSVPVIGRIKEGRVLLDMRTFSEDGIEYLAKEIRRITESNQH